jgi:hypothetical protein
MRKVCGVLMARLQGKLGAAPVDRSAMNVGTILGLPARCGQARCRLLAPGGAEPS